MSVNILRVNAAITWPLTFLLQLADHLFWFFLLGPVKALHLLDLAIFSVQNLRMERETEPTPQLENSDVFFLLLRKWHQLLKFLRAMFTKAKLKYTLCNPDIKKTHLKTALRPQELTRTPTPALDRQTDTAEFLALWVHVQPHKQAHTHKHAADGCYYTVYSCYCTALIWKKTWIRQ